MTLEEMNYLVDRYAPAFCWGAVFGIFIYMVRFS
jgi:hypothetical protein